MIPTISFKAKVEGAVWGGVTGDVLGLAHEKKTKEEILKVVGDIREYMPISGNGFLKNEFNKPDFRYKPEDTGVISDDSIFTMAGMKSITTKGAIDIQHLFDTHKELFDQYGGQWFGGDTRKKFNEYTGDISTLKNASWGNGIMMKMAPYSILFTWQNILNSLSDYTKPAKDEEEIEKIITVTHDTPVAKITGLLHNKTLMYLLNTQPEHFDQASWLQYLLRLSHIYEDRFIDEEDLLYHPDTHMYISPIIKKLLKQQQAIGQGKAYSLQQILDTYIIKLHNPIENKKMKPGFHVASTFGLVYACFLQNQDFEGLLNTIRIGYDTDTQAAIIGNMIGALQGPFYEQKYIDGIQDKAIIQEIVDNFQKSLTISGGE